MDAAGKDSAIKSIFADVNPQGCDVASFKQPSMNEDRARFHVRHVIALPRRGDIGIFNRSYYAGMPGHAGAPRTLGQGKAFPRNW